MKNIVRSVLIALLVSCLAGLPAMAAESLSQSGDRLNVREDPPGELILVDALVVRPLGIVACIVGAVGTIVISPFTASSRSCDRVENELLKKPADFTFKRPLGDMDDSL